MTGVETMDPFVIGDEVEVRLVEFWDMLPERYESLLGPVGSRHTVTGALFGRVRVAAVEEPIDFDARWFRGVAS